MATATPEQIAANKKEFNMYCNDPAFGEKMTKEMNATWAQSDANGDGKLNKQEFLTFTKAMNAQLEARGCFADKRPEMFEKLFYKHAVKLQPFRLGIGELVFQPAP